MEMLGVQLPGSSFLHPEDPMRPALTRRTVQEVMGASADGQERSLSQIVTEASLVNAVVALLATGGSTNHTLHLVAIARSAGIDLTWKDMDTLSSAVPLLARIYPNGSADINDFQDAGGMAFLVRELRSAGLLNEDVTQLLGAGLDAACCAPALDEGGEITWSEQVTASLREDVLAPLARCFSPEGGLRSLSGNLGQSVIKVSAVAQDQLRIKAPCRIFTSQDALREAFEAGQLDRDVVAVVRFQGPAANGMPELHKMTPYLGSLQDRGFRVALVTDGRMSGASGKVPAAIHLTPEAYHGGPISLLRDGDLVELDAVEGSLVAHVPDAEWRDRVPATMPAACDTLGRNLFEVFRRATSGAMQGASVFEPPGGETGQGER
jgi:phosphogluconate dehydratase